MQGCRVLLEDISEDDGSFVSLKTSNKLFNNYQIKHLIVVTLTSSRLNFIARYLEDGNSPSLYLNALFLWLFVKDGAHYMIYTPSDPLLFVAVKVYFSFLFIFLKICSQLYIRNPILFFVNQNNNLKFFLLSPFCMLISNLSFVCIYFWSLLACSKLNNDYLLVQDKDGWLQIADDVRYRYF